MAQGARIVGVGAPAARVLARACPVALACSLLAFGATARAEPPSVGLRVIAEAEQGGINLLKVPVSSTAGARCELRVSAGGRTRTFHSRTSGSVTWSWTEPVNAPRGMWSFVATCRQGPYWTWRRFESELGFPRPSGALREDAARVPDEAAVNGAPSCDTQGVCFDGDPFEIGQCGWYAAGLRPDLLGTVGIVHDDVAAWLGEAEGRVPEGTVPVVGALAVWAPNIPGYSGVFGHVAYVAAVSGSRIFVYDSNWKPTPWSPGLEVHEHWDPTSSVTGFIYGGPAGDGVSASAAARSSSSRAGHRPAARS